MHKKIWISEGGGTLLRQKRSPMNLCRRPAFIFALVATPFLVQVVARASDSLSTPAAVAFPGPDPGSAIASQKDGLFTLGNGCISASWRFSDNAIRPEMLFNKLAGGRFDQQSSELFRLGTQSAATDPSATDAAGAGSPSGYIVMIRLESDKIVALVSKDRVAWHELARFPRSEFPGEPSVVRIGKMDGNAQPKNHGGDHGPPGTGSITELTPKPPSIPSGRFNFKANANDDDLTQYPFPAGTTSISCRIDKGSDQGLTWGPALALVWEDGKKFLCVGVREKNPTFNVETAGNQQIIGARLEPYPVFDLPASAVAFQTPVIVHLDAKANGSRLADRIGGMAIEADATSSGGLHIHWRAELRDGSNYIRQTVHLTSPNQSTNLSAVELADVRMPDMATIGTCPGCPVFGGGMFAGVEMPGAMNAVDESGARIGFACKLQVSPTQSYDFGQVIGVAAAGQLRRSFLFYVERERARPSKPFLHYNSWYDLGYGISEKGIMDAVHAYHDEMVVKRGVPIQSYLIDDGWDQTSRGLWAENLTIFPDGFAGMKQKMEPLGAHLGIWISPLGGYGGREGRRDKAREMGLIPKDASLDFSYPKYKQWFQDRCEQLMREDGVNIFKWDKAGEGVSPHFMGLLDIASHLRTVNPDVFINVTVGTWPSPFWLNFIDTTWRDGSGDVAWAGKGNDPANPKYDREKWLTFRDGYCHRLFVVQSPLYPLNSVMHHGIVLGRNFQGESVAKSGAHLTHEARSYFANGASLQELYLSPTLMTSAAWDEVADAAKWAHANADVLVDSHWVGGDPLKLEVYGYGAWNWRKGTLMLRNPDDKEQSISIDAATIFDLPPGAPMRYRVTSPYPDTPSPIAELVAGKPQAVTLQPFDVLVLDMMPEK